MSGPTALELPSTQAKIEGAHQIRREHDAQSRAYIGQRREIPLPEERQDHRERVLGKELLPAQDHDEEADAVAKLRYQRAPWRVREMGTQQALGKERESHRKARRQPGPREGRVCALEFVLPLRLDRQIKDMAPGRTAFLGLLLLRLGAGNGNVAFDGHGRLSSNSGCSDADIGRRHSVPRTRAFGGTSA